MNHPVARGPAALGAEVLAAVAAALAGDVDVELVDLRLVEAAAAWAARSPAAGVPATGMPAVGMPAVGMPAVGAEPAVAFAAACASLTAAGWGRVEVIALDAAARLVRVRVNQPWEAPTNAGRGYPPGCPLLRGLLAHAFGQVLSTRCWAEALEADPVTGSVLLLVRESNRTFASEADRLRRDRDRRHERELDRIVQERVRATAEERRDLEARQNALLRERTQLLRQEIAQREQAERFKDELIATVNHELRTPLTSIRGFAELLVHRELTTEQRERFLRTIDRESARLAQLIDDFLDLARLEARTEAAAHAPVDLLPLLRAAADRFAARTRPVELDVPAVLPHVLGDGRRLEQVLTNLVGNAVKFTPAEGRVVLRAAATDHEVVMSVQDEGPGIPAEAVPKLFTRFFRVDNQETRNVRGTGLGLAIVKQIVIEHGGRVWVESTPGAGSRFSVALPCG